MMVPNFEPNRQQGLPERYLQGKRSEAERRTNSGHLRMTFLGTMTLGVIALYGLAWGSPLDLAWWGPLGSIAIAFLAFGMLLWVSRPHLSHTAILRQLFWLRRERPTYGESLHEAKVATEESVLIELGRDVDFYRWGLPRREIQYIRAGILLALSVLPLAAAIIQHIRR
jgi:hypothetical protein